MDKSEISAAAIEMAQYLTGKPILIDKHKPYSAEYYPSHPLMIGNTGFFILGVFSLIFILPQLGGLWWTLALPFLVVPLIFLLKVVAEVKKRRRIIEHGTLTNGKLVYPGCYGPLIPRTYIYKDMQGVVHTKHTKPTGHPVVQGKLIRGEQYSFNPSRAAPESNDIIVAYDKFGNSVIVNICSLIDG
jgi:hypothetical protein